MQKRNVIVLIVSQAALLPSPALLTPFPPPTPPPWPHPSPQIGGLLDEALLRIAARPSREQVEQEVGAWRAAQPAALAGVARHVAAGVLHEVVDELIAEVGAGGTHVVQQLS